MAKKKRNARTVLGILLLIAIMPVAAYATATTKNVTVKVKIDLSAASTSKATDMSFMLREAGEYAAIWNIGDLSGWDTSGVTKMAHMFRKSAKAKTSITIMQALTDYYLMFDEAATETGSGITVNYSSAVTNIDAILASKSSNSNVVKGVQID